MMMDRMTWVDGRCMAGARVGWRVGGMAGGRVGGMAGGRVGDRCPRSLRPANLGRGAAARPRGLAGPDRQPLSGGRGR